MARIIPFIFENDNLIRVVAGADGEPWFVAADVCRVLGIKNSRDAIDSLDEDEKGVALTDTLGGQQEVNTISESGLYALAFRSRKPAAIRFRKWVTREVIPSIRKTGEYSVKAEPMNGEVIAPPAEHRPFPDWPMEEIRTKKGVVDMYRLLYGTMAGQWIAPQLGFPPPPKELIEAQPLPLFSQGYDQAA